jgi:hypothetical protein
MKDMKCFQCNQFEAEMVCSGSEVAIVCHECGSWAVGDSIHEALNVWSTGHRVL